MPSAEGRGGRPRQPGEPRKEAEQPPYHKAARFGGEEQAAQVYFEAQETIFNDTESELSAYRFMLDTVSHVAVLGEQPSTETDQALTALLSQGELVALPQQVLVAFNQRRTQMKRHGSWVEGHYRPGKEL